MFWPPKLFYYVLPYNYYIRSAMYLIFSESTWEPCTDPTTSAVCVNSTNGLDVLEALNEVFPLVTTEDTYWSDIGFMLVLGVFWKIVAVITIMIKSRGFAPIRDERMDQTQVMNTASPAPDQQKGENSDEEMDQTQVMNTASPAPDQQLGENSDEFAC